MTYIYRYIQIYTGKLPTKKEEGEVAKIFLRKPRLVKKNLGVSFFYFLGDFFWKFFELF